MKNLFEPPKTIALDLVGLDGNAFYLMSSFSKRARREGWTNEEIDTVLAECRRADYYHLLATLMEHCESPEGEN